MYEHKQSFFNSGVCFLSVPVLAAEPETTMEVVVQPEKAAAEAMWLEPEHVAAESMELEPSAAASDHVASECSAAEPA